MTKIGIEITSRVLISTKLSTNRPFRMPARTPAEMPMMISQSTAMIASLIVVGYRMASSWATELP